MSRQVPDPESREAQPDAAVRLHAENELLAQADWVRRLTGALVQSASEADDLAQDTLVAALTASRPIRSVRNYLGGTARKLAADRRRDAARRREREGRTTTDPNHRLVAPPADDSVERLELASFVLERIAELPAAQRRALTLRYLDDLEPREIAAREGVAPATVRAHIARGLATLRERLDDRSGGRRAWLSVLAPEAARRLPPMATGQTALIGGMIMLPKLMLATCLVVLVLSVLRFAAPAHERSPLGDPTTRVEAWTGTGITQPVRSRSAIGRSAASVEAPTSVGPGASDEAAHAPKWPNSIQLVDALTEEPVPHFSVRISPDSSNDPTLELVSNELGIVVLPDRAELEALGDEIHVVEHYGPPGERREGRTNVMSAPLPSTLSVAVGATFYFTGGERDPESAYRSGEVSLRDRDEAEAGESLTTAWRGGGSPWVRFSPASARLGERGPYLLEWRDPSGFWVGTAEVHRKIGIEPEPVRFDFDARGGLSFHMDLDGGRMPPPHMIEVEPETDVDVSDVETRTSLNEHTSNGSASGRLAHLRPGRYRWTLNVLDTQTSGRAEVFAGEWTEIQLDEESLGPTFDSEVRIDASAHPDVDLGPWIALVSSVDHPELSSMQRLARADEAHQWRIPLVALNDGTWNVRIVETGGVQLDRDSVVVTPGSPPPVVRIVDSPAPCTLTLRVVDADTGDLIESAEAGIVRVPDLAEPFRRVEDGLLVCDAVPAGREVEIVVRAPGRALRVLRHRSEDASATRTIRLERGWRNRVLVLQMPEIKPVRGVGIKKNGEVIARTDAHGFAFLDEKPTTWTFDLALDEAKWSAHTAEEPGDGSDPLFGWVYLITPSGGD